MYSGRVHAVLVCALLLVAGCGSGGESERPGAAASPTTHNPAKPLVSPVRCGSQVRAPLAELPPPGTADSYLSPEFRPKYEPWLRSTYVRDLDLRTVERVTEQSEGIGGAASFDAAVDRAEVVVAGTVERVVCVPMRMVTYVRVDRVAKGQVGDEIVVLQQGYLYPEPRESSDDPLGAGRLMSDDGRPLLLPGERAMLLLASHTVDSTSPYARNAAFGGLPSDATVHFVQDESGIYFSENGRVRQVEQNRQFDVTGESEAALMDRAADRARRFPRTCDLACDRSEPPASDRP